MNETRLEGVSASVFDACGTPFDFASAAARCRDALGDRLDRLNALWREKQLQKFATDAGEGEIVKLKGDLARFCPVSKILRESGTETEEICTISRR